MDPLVPHTALVRSTALGSRAAVWHAGARSVLQFVRARAARGFAESAAYPGAVKSVAEWFPRRERALGVGILNAGAKVGVLLTPLVGIAVAGAFGWRAAFLVTGLDRKSTRLNYSH